MSFWKGLVLAYLFGMYFGFVSGEDVCDGLTENPKDSIFTDCVLRKRNIYEVAVCLPCKWYHRILGRRNCWNHCDFKGSNKICKCNERDKNNPKTIKLPAQCFSPEGDCSWYGTCLAAAFPCLRGTKEYDFIQPFCEILGRTQKVFNPFEWIDIYDIHKCIQKRFFPILTQFDKYTCDNVTDVAGTLDKIVAKCIRQEKEDILDMNSRQFVFWTMKDLLDHAEPSDGSVEITHAFNEVFSQPRKDIIPSIVFVVRYLRFRPGNTLKSWVKSIANTLRWHELNITSDCKTSFESEEKSKNKRGIFTTETKIECNIGSSLKHGYPLSDHQTHTFIFEGLNRTMKEATFTTLSLSSLTWCCYQGIGCIKNPMSLSGIVRNDDKKYPKSIEENGVSFSLFTRGTPTPKEQRLEITDDFGGTAKCFRHTYKTYFVIHGFTSNANVNFADDDHWVSSMVKDILRKEDSYVVTVNWEEGASGLFSYDQAAINTLTVGTVTAHVISLLVDSGCTELGNVHIIGHSLGAHTAGFAGSSLGGKIGRITGMDPAGPFFESKGEDSRLDKGDALFVDIIHTDGRVDENLIKGLGIFYPIGHVDFYPNGGEIQPGCNFIPCSHGRSHQLFIESITSDCFVGQECPTAHDCHHGTNLGNKTAVMGFGTATSSRGYFYLTTKDEYPYCINSG